MLFWKRKKTLNSEEYLEIKRRMDALEIDLTLLSDKLTKAIHKRVIKKTEEKEEGESNKNEQILPI